MSKISSSTLFHFTRTFDNLKGILIHGFFPRYSLEEFILKDRPPSKFAFPMVCFCDIPLSQAKDHMKDYWNYGIGMSREWIRDNQLNPVFYLHKDSHVADVTLKLLTALIKDVDKADSNCPEAALTFENFFTILRHTKPFEGTNNGVPVKYYDEREWRYTPPIEKILPKPILQEEEYNNPKVLSERNKAIEEHRLAFNHDDIKYVIVNDEDEIPELVGLLSSIYSEDPYSSTIEVLTTKIITSKQIENDF